MTTHDWARDMQKTAEFLLSRPEVKVGDKKPINFVAFYGEKEAFVNVVRAMVPGRKSIDEWNVTFTPKGYINFFIQINRSAVCRKVQDVKYECEPLLSPEEEAELDVTA